MSTKKKANSGNPAKRAAELEQAPPAEPEATRRAIVVEYDGTTWVIDPTTIDSPEMLYMLAEMQAYAEEEDDLDEAEIPEALTVAMGVIRLLFGRQQGRRFARGSADLDALGTRLKEFFAAASARAGRPDPTDGLRSSDGTEEPSTQPSDAATA